MDHCLLMRVLHRLTDIDKESQALGSWQVVLVAVVRDGNTAHQFHDEIRPTGLCCAAVQHPGDVEMVHQGQGLALSLEPGDDFARVHPWPDDLEGDLALHRLLLIGHIDHAETALADLLKQYVAHDHRAWRLHFKIRRGQRNGLAEEVSGLLMRSQQGFDLCAQFGFSLASLGQKVIPLYRRLSLQRLREEFFEAFVGDHGLMGSVEPGPSLSYFTVKW